MIRIDDPLMLLLSVVTLVLSIVFIKVEDGSDSGDL